MNVGDKVIFIKKPSDADIGAVGTIVHIDGSKYHNYKVLYDNCSHENYFYKTSKTYCNGFTDGPGFWFETVKINKEINNTARCACLSYDLFHFGHNPNCPEKKKR